MKEFKKHYLGKGRQIETRTGHVLDIVKITVNVEELVKYIHKYQGVDYLTMEIAKLKNEDQFCHTHTVYTATLEKVEEPEEEETQEAPKPKRVRRTKAQIEADRIADKQEIESMQKQTDDLPY